MINFKEYDGRSLCQCFYCFDVPEDVNITQDTIKLRNKEDSSIIVQLKNAKYLSYNDIVFAKLDDNGIIRIL